MMSGFLTNIVVENSQYNYPLSPHTRKLLNCIDILNKGFYEESLISAFSLVDATTQDTAKAGLKTLGLKEKQQENRIRAIKQDRLEHFLCAMMKSCRWKSLKESEPVLFREFIGDVKRSTNTVRNKIAHKDRRINKEEAMRHLDVMFRVLRWLSQNPFGVQIRLPPELRYANPNFRTNIPVGNPQNEPRASREPETAE